MSQKKLPEKINSLDIFSTGIELEPIYDDKTIITATKVIVASTSISDNSFDSTSDNDDTSVIRLSKSIVDADMVSDVVDTASVIALNDIYKSQSYLRATPYANNP